MPGTQRVALLVLELYQGSPELRKVVVDKVIQLFRGKDSLVLDDLYVSPAVDYLVLGVPKRRVADEVSAVVQESRSDSLSELPPVLLQLLQRLSLHYAHKTVRPLLLVLRSLGSGLQRLDGQKGRQNHHRQKDQSAFVSFDFHSSSWNSQSWNNGSILM